MILDTELRLHLCPACENDLCTGVDEIGRPTLCRECEEEWRALQNPPPAYHPSALAKVSIGVTLICLSLLGLMKVLG